MGQIKRRLSSVMDLDACIIPKSRESSGSTPTHTVVENPIQLVVKSTPAGAYYSKPYTSLYTSGMDEDTKDWICDDIQASLAAPKKPRRSARLTFGSGEPPQTDNSILEFSRKHPPPPFSAEIRKLLYPVIIPQKRPGSGRRGFVKAYAPALDELGLDGETFSDFMVGLEAAIVEDPHFNAINLSEAMNVMSEMIADEKSAVDYATTLAVHRSIEVERSVELLDRHNTYLTALNNILFKPRGLYAMLVTANIEAQLRSEADLSRNIEQVVTHGSSNSEGSRRKSSVKVQMIECTGLIFPGLQEANNDPSRQASRGGIAKLLSENLLGKRMHSSRGRKSREHPLIGHERKEQLITDSEALTNVKRTLHENILYLMIVNMPSEAKARQAVALAS